MFTDILQTSQQSRIKVSQREREVQPRHKINPTRWVHFILSSRLLTDGSSSHVKHHKCILIQIQTTAAQVRLEIRSFFFCKVILRSMCNYFKFEGLQTKNRVDLQLWKPRQPVKLTVSTKRTWRWKFCFQGRKRHLNLDHAGESFWMF